MAVPALSASSPVSASSSLTPALFKRLHPLPYLSRFLNEGVRPDGRPLGAQANEQDVWREASVNIGSVSTAPSSALVRLGKTSLVCGVTLEIAPPDLARPNEGFIVPNVDLSPLCSPLFRPGPPADGAQVLSARLRDVLLASNVLPLSSLVIEPGKAVWVVYLDVVCLNYDGGILDAAVLSAVGALKNLTLPTATWDIDANQAVCEPITETSPGVRIPLAAEPYSISFGVFNNHLLLDPTLFESQLCTSEITVVLSALPDSPSASLAKALLVSIYQAGAPLENGREALKECIKLARKRAVELRSTLG
ncbi:hypothetical protein JCM8547_009141 [Rhodosporidiobolus lusitaniae]